MALKKKYLHLVHTGNGKGKTSAAMNMAYRHLSHRKKVAIVQFVKCTDDFPDGDRKMLLALKEMGYPVELHTMGIGFSWNSVDEKKDISAANEALVKAVEYLKDDKTRLVILDEVHVAIDLGWIDEERVIAAVTERHPRTHVVTTGRGASQQIMEIADLVTEMSMIKHHFEKDIHAQPGIEF